MAALINARLKKKHKAQWNRDSAHKVLQLRTALLSNQWDQDWQLVKEEIYKNYDQLRPEQFVVLKNNGDILKGIE